MLKFFSNPAQGQYKYEGKKEQLHHKNIFPLYCMALPLNVYNILCEGSYQFKWGIKIKPNGPFIIQGFL